MASYPRPGSSIQEGPLARLRNHRGLPASDPRGQSRQGGIGPSRTEGSTVKISSGGKVFVNGTDITGQLSSIDFDMTLNPDGFEMFTGEFTVTLNGPALDSVEAGSLMEIIYGMTYDEFLNMQYSPSSLHETGWEQ